MAGTRRMRVFAGPNGSGKSTMKAQVAQAEVQGQRIDLGVYVNPDEIEMILLRTKRLDFRRYKVVTNKLAFERFAFKSGLLKTPLDRAWFRQAQLWGGNVLKLRTTRDAKRMAQLVALHLYPALLARGRKFSFETVFSHSSKLALMAQAARQGYKVYLYFVATGSADINVDRVRDRVLKGGHDVPEKKVRERYELSLQQLLPALDLCYRAFLFDNSEQRTNEGTGPRLFAEMKRTTNGVVWHWDTKGMPNWFIQHVLIASGDPQFMAIARQALEDR